MIEKIINIILKILNNYREDDNILLLERYLDDGQCTLGKLAIKCYEFSTLELPWRENQKRISCIPVGDYDIKIKNSKKFGECIELLNVSNRSGILIHSGNTHFDTTGCILNGENAVENFYDEKHKSYCNYGITNSKNSIDKLIKIVKEFNINKIKII